MTVKDRIASLFPAWDEIPVQFRIPAPIDQREYLINGELHHFDGAVQEVFSPVCIETDAGGGCASVSAASR